MYLITEKSTIAWSIVLTCLATILVSLRLLQRRKIEKIHKTVTSIILGSHLDDIFCLIALFFVIPTSVVIIWGASKGAVGSHSDPSDVELWINTVTPKWVTLAQVVWVVMFLQPLALGFIKLSVLFFYRRLFMGTVFNILSWILIGIVAAWMTAFSLGLFFDCGTNFAANWGSLATISEECGFGFMPTIIYTILDACLDLAILVFPIPWVFKLQMSFKKKLSVCGCLMLGSFATAAAFVRMVIFIESGIPSAALDKEFVLGLPVYDVAGIVGAEMFWTMIESTVALTAICLPTIKKIVSLSQLGKSLGLSSLFSRVYAGYRSTKLTKGSNGTVSEMTNTDLELGERTSQSSRAGLTHEKDFGYQVSEKTGKEEELTGMRIYKAQEVTVICAQCTQCRYKDTKEEPKDWFKDSEAQ